MFVIQKAYNGRCRVCDKYNTFRQIRLPNLDKERMYDTLHPQAIYIFIGPVKRITKEGKQVLYNKSRYKLLLDSSRFMTRWRRSVFRQDFQNDMFGHLN